VRRRFNHPNTPAPVQAWMRTLPAWVAVKTPTFLDPSIDVDAGELEAICLAREIGAAAVLMDDRAGRHAAAQCGLAVIGTLGLLEQAAMRGWIDLPQTLERLQQTNARIDPALIEALLKRHTARNQASAPKGLMRHGGCLLRPENMNCGTRQHPLFRGHNR
jgi:hypothetical protein